MPEMAGNVRTSEVNMSIACEKVTEQKHTHIKRALYKLFDNINYNFKPGSSVMIKPNFGGRNPKLKSDNTSFAMLSALIEILDEYKCKVMIGHTPLLYPEEIYVKFDELIENLGMYGLKKYHKDLRFINLEDEEKVLKTSNEFSFRIPKILYEVDHYINLARMKMHFQTQVSMCIKNQMGVLDKEQKKDFHRGGLQVKLGNMANVLAPSLNIIEGIYAMQGEGPHHGEDFKMNVLIAGDNLVEVDSLASYLLEVPADEVIHIKTAQQLGVGGFFNARDSIDNSYRALTKLKRANKNIRIGKKLDVWGTTGCSTCGMCLVAVLKTLKKNPKYWAKLVKLLFFNEVHFVFGSGIAENHDLIEKLKTKKRVLFIGNCTKKTAEEYNFPHIAGCPPKIAEVFEVISREGII